MTGRRGCHTGSGHWEQGEKGGGCVIIKDKERSVKKNDEIALDSR